MTETPAPKSERVYKQSAETRAANRAAYHRRMSDPEYALKVKAKQKIATAKFYERVKANPEKRKARNEQTRLKNNENYNQKWKKRYIRNVKGAEDRGIVWQLTEEETRHIFEDGRCHYCDRSRKELGRLLGIDRKDNTVGYLLENSVSCCKVCNFKKQKQDYSEFVAWLRIIGQARGSE